MPANQAFGSNRDAQSDTICHFGRDVDKLAKLLKIKAFILEKSLDTTFQGPIRFRQKVLMDFEPPLELFSLEKKAVQLPDGLWFFPPFTISKREISIISEIANAASTVELAMSCRVCETGTGVNASVTGCNDPQVRGL